MKKETKETLVRYLPVVLFFAIYLIGFFVTKSWIWFITEDEWHRMSNRYNYIKNVFGCRGFDTYNQLVARIFCVYLPVLAFLPSYLMYKINSKKDKQ